jgi:hypothetical protein
MSGNIPGLDGLIDPEILHDNTCPFLMDNTLETEGHLVGSTSPMVYIYRLISPFFLAGEDFLQLKV